MKSLLIILLLVTSGVFAGERIIGLEVNGLVKMGKTGLTQATVALFKSGNYFNSVNSDTKGKFQLQLETDSFYQLVISKEGFYPVKVIFNTMGIITDEGALVYRFSTELYPKIKGVDGSIFDTPISEIVYNEYTDNMEKIIDKETVKRMDEFVIKYELTKHLAYSATIVKADSAFITQNYKLASELYSIATQQNAYDFYPDYQLEMIGRILNQDTKNNEKYQHTIIQADALYVSKEYKKAKKYYKKALKYKDEEYASERIAAIDKGIALKEVYAKN